MSTPYFRPQAIVQGEFVPLASSIIQAQPVVLIGAEKKVFEANDTDDRAYINYGAYVPSADTTYSYAGRPAGAIVDQSSVNLILEDILALYANLNGAGVIERGTAANQINIPSQNGFQEFNNGTTTYLRNSVFVNRDVQVGDRVKVTSGSIVLDSRITGFVNDVVAAVVPSSLSNDADNPATVALSNPATTVINDGGTDHVVTTDTATTVFLGDLTKGYITDTYTLEVTVGGPDDGTAKFKVTSLRGDNVAEGTFPTFGTAFDIGTRGLRAAIASAGPDDFVVGEKYSFSPTAAYTQEVATRNTGAAVYNGLFDTTYVITVIKGGTWDTNPQVSVTTTSGIDSGGPLVAPIGQPFVLGSLGIAAQFGISLPTCTTTASSITVTTASTAGLVVGAHVFGEGIAIGAKVATITPGVSFTMTIAATASGTVPLYFDVNPQGGLRLGDKYTLAVTASKKGAVRTAILANPMDDSINAGDPLDVDFMIYKSSLEIPSAGYPLFGSTALTTSASDFIVKAGIEIEDASWTEIDAVTLDPIPVVSATVVVPYNALLTTNANVLRSISDLSAVTSVAGKVVPENPMGYALDKALQNAGSQPVYFISIETDDIEGFRTALGAHEAAGVGYFVVPLSSDSAIQDLVASHVDSLNGIEKRKRCVGFVSTALPSISFLYNQKPDESNWLGYVSLLSGSSPAQYTHLHVPGATFITDGVRPGDVLRTQFGIDAFGNPTYSTAVIDSVIDEESADLVAPGFSVPVGTSGTPVQIQIVRTLTKDEQATLQAANSSRYSDRFVYNIYPNIPLNSDVPGFFVAAAAAGLASSVAPHQPITNYTLNGFSDQSGSVIRFTPTQLDVMAEGGTFIIAQDVLGGQIYIRHQLSSDNTDDLTSELSATRNVHSIEQFLEEGLRPLIGKYNITDYFIQLIDVTCRQKLNYLTANAVTVSAGPQIRSWDPGTLEIVQSPVLRTQVDITVEIQIPLPANRIVMKVRVTA